MLTLKVKKLNPDAQIPTKAHASDRCFDLYSVSEYEIAPYGTKIIKTGIAIKLPDGWGAQILGRSGMSARGFDVFGGVIDNAYLGEWGVILHNSTNDYQRIETGDKVAQFELVKQHEVDIIEVDELGESDRGEKGFGSSGK